MRIEPDVGVSRPAIMRSNVVLPQPDGPNSTRNSPSSVAKSTPSTARTSPSKCLIRERTSTVAMPCPQPSAGAADQSLVAPLLEDGLDLALGVGHHLLRAGVAPRRPGHHLGQHERPEDLALGRVGGTGIADVGR